MSRVFDVAFVRRLGADIDADVVPILDGADEILSEVDRGLAATVALPMADADDACAKALEGN